MLADEYEKAVANTTLPALVIAHQMLSLFRPNPMTEADWIAFLQAIYPTVRERSLEAARIARSFYDAERARQIPGVPLQPVPIYSLTFEQFVRTMEPSWKIAQKPDFSVDQVVARVARTVENGARRTMIRAVEDPDPALDPVISSQEDEVQVDPDRPDDFEDEYEKKPKDPAPKVQSLVRGWARVPTGRETCGFCWMLASRGPVYDSAGSAGGKRSQAEIIRKTADGSMSSDDMNQWHPGCDCKVVPVFKLSDWPGKDKADAAWKLWKDKIQGYYSGKDAINAYRRLVESGEIQRLLSGLLAA